MFRSAIYQGDVVHARIRPRRHKLHYGVFALVLELDELDQLDHRLRFFSRNRFNLFSLHDRDHCTGDGCNLEDTIERLLERNGLFSDRWRISMLCYPRVLGYVFNPLTVYFCTDDEQGLRAMIYEVNNTFGGRHHYVVPVDADGRDVQAHGQAKRLHVSPFNQVEGDYGFRVRVPGDDVLVSILYRDRSGPVLRAQFAGQRHALGDAALLRMAVSYPFLTLKIIGAIHVEALKLWLKGVPFFGKKTNATTSPTSRTLTTRKSA